MTWHAWVYTRSRWEHVCSAVTLAEAARELGRLRPDAPSTSRALTGGSVPDWAPGGYLRDYLAGDGTGSRSALSADRTSVHCSR